MRRREFIVLVGSAAAAWPFVARAQQRAIPVIGYLGAFGSSDRLVPAFRKGLRETGYVEGQNVSIEYRSTEGRNDPMAALPFAKDLVDRRVSVIVAATVPLAKAAKSVTQTIPIVFRAGTDPVAAGLVANLNRPGANVTGISTFGQDLGPKRMELLREFLSPGAGVAVLVNQNNIVAAAEAKEVQAAAHLLGLHLTTLNVSSLTEIDTAFEGIARQNVKGLLIINDLAFFVQRDHLAALAARTALPAVFADRIFAEAGGLMSYGTDVPDGFRLTGVYTGRILNGENPVNLPVQQSTKVELVINMKTAKALGLTIPRILLARADEVIE
jgi:putative tryptophan/tyrosine transport system substrate-binding protein